MLLNRGVSPAGRAPTAAAALLALVVCGFCVAGSGSEDDTPAGDMPGPRRQLVLTVDWSGRGDHRRVQDAVDAAPANSSAGSVVIRIKPGVYRQVVVVVVLPMFNL